MSKISQALEKAARERLRRLQEKPTVQAPAIALPLESPPSRLGAIFAAGSIEVDPHIVAATDSTSPISEQYRILRTNLQSLRLRPGPKVIVVTSAVHGEGKSVTALNLAMTLARQEHMKVVLVDADLRKGSIHKWVGLSSDGVDGLSTVLSRQGELNGSLLKLKEPPLTILPSGAHPDHPSELLESSSMKRVLATLKNQFDMIIVDSPPVLPVADPGILAAQADGVLLVVRAGKTQRKTVEQARALLTQMQANILGCVLTHVEYYLPGYYRYYHYYREGMTKGKSPDAQAAGATGGDIPKATRKKPAAP